MKKYIQYNAAQYASPSPVEVGSRSNTIELGSRSNIVEVGQRSIPLEVGSRSNPIEVGSRSSSVNSDRSKDDYIGALDLSGKHGKMPVTMATNQAWPQEQDSALDLSSSRPNAGGQAEALDLSKPSSFRADSTSKGLFPISTGIHQSARSLSQTPPTGNVTKPVIGQYSLLQAALNSTQPNTVVHPALPDTASLDSRARMIAALAALDASRGIKPFANMGPRPFGMPIPPLSYPNPPVTVIQGVHKPIAITAPQPHVSNVESKSQTPSQTTISVSQSNHMSVSEKDKLQYTSSSQGMMADKLLIQESYQRDAERYVLQSQGNSNGVVDHSKLMHVENTEGFTCLQCKKVYKTKAALKLHATVHKTSDERQYECPMCKRRFLHRHHLVVHQRKHSGERPFKCDACGKTFMAIFLLHKHLRKHVRETGPNCLIASQQLTQLNVKKDSMDGTGYEKISMTKTKDFPDMIFPGKGPVIPIDDASANNLLSDADKLTKLHEMNQALISRKTEMAVPEIPVAPIEVIDLSSDELNSSYGSGKDQKFTRCKSVHHQEASDLDSSIEASGNICHKGKQESEADEDFNIASQAEQLENGNCSNLETEIQQSSDTAINGHVNQEQEQEKCVKEVDSDKPNPFPLYTSDDEVELDFITGELKIMSKQADKTDGEHENKNNKEFIDSESTSGELKIMSKQSDKIDSESENQHNKDSIDSECTSVNQANKTEVSSYIEKETDIEITGSKDNGNDSTTETADEEEIAPNIDNPTSASSDVNETNDFIEDKSAEVEKDLCDEPMPDISDNCEKSDITANDALQTKNNEPPKVKTDRNIFEDVQSGIVYKDLNMNEQSISEVVNELSVSDNPGINTNDEPKTLLPDIHHDEDTLSAEEHVTYDIPNTESRRKTKNRKSRKGRRVKCEVCSRTFHSNHHLILHMAVHKKNQMLQSLKKAKAQQLKSMGYQQQKTNVICHICKKGFKFQKSLNSHMRVHSEKMAKQRELSRAFRDFMSEAVPSSRTTERTLSSPTGVTSESHPMSKNRTLSSDKSDITELETNNKVISESHSGCVEYLDQYSKFDRQYDPPIKVIIGKDNVKRYLCHACDNTYTTKQKLRMHALIHKDNCFLCDICGKSFFRLLTLEKHIATHKLPRPHVCLDCRKSFIHRSSLMRHRVIHEKPNQPSVKQQVEDINFELKMLDTYSMLRKERMQQIQTAKLNEINVDPANPVQNSPVKFEAKEDILDLSVRVKTEDVSLPPVLSPANTPNSLQLNPLHLSPPVITGEHCQGSPNGRGEPAAKSDVKPEPAQSVQLEDQVSSETLLMENSSDGRKRRYSEEQIGPTEGTSDTFHKKSRKTRVYQTSCRFCKEKFPNVMTLKAHMAVHNTVETHLYECSVCNHRFTQSCSLLRHLKTSCQENRLKCVPCGKSFHHKQSYNQHMKLHNGIPPNLDGSFYDKRRDEVEGIQVKEERESDIENNNTKNLIHAHNLSNVDACSLLLNLNQSVKSECLPVQSANMETRTIKDESVLFDQSIKPGPSRAVDTNYDSDDDAKTFIYSEGKGRLNDLHDFSDMEETQALSDSKKVLARPPSVDSVSSSGAMTLNLLSAVCSDIRNAEKEEETRRKEQEERQKELETIEILANLKRGRLQSSSSTHSADHDNTSSVQGDQSVLSLLNAANATQINSDKTSNIPHTKPSANIDSYKPTLPYRSPEIMSPPLHKYEPKNILNVPQIPTVVFEIAAEAEKLRQERLAKLGTHQSDMKGSSQRMLNKDGINSPAFSPQAQFLQNLSQMTLHERLSLLMKAQIPPTSTNISQPIHPPSQPIHPPSPHPLLNKPSTPVPTYTMTRPQSVPSFTSPPTHSKHVKIPPQVLPQDLSMKKPPTSAPMFHASPPMFQHFHKTSTPSPSTHTPGTRPHHRLPEAGPKFPGLVPTTFHCELCGKLIHNHVEYQQHLQEHLHAIQMKGHNLLATHGHLGNPGQRSWFLDRAQNLNGPGTPTLPRDDPAKLLPVVPVTETNMSPSTLDLSVKKTFSTPSSTHDIPSPMTSSDFSNDTIPSPSTPSSSAAAMNLDLLRKELRNKIYARRRSQGLEELTVEFKAPEPTEMTEEERAKLDYRRECNRQAAQRSRMRKKDLVDSLIEELHQEGIVNSDLRQNLESLTAEKKFLRNVLDSHTCVKDKAIITAEAATSASKLEPKEDDQSY